jgi:hypothetical protein
MMWVIVVLVVVGVLAIGAVLIEQRRSGALRSRFGPEYERELEARGDRRAAEAELRSRLRARKAMEIEDLSPAARARVVEQWRSVQAGFVDDPRQALASATQLIEQVALDLGYRAEAGDGDGDGGRSTEPVDLVAIDHPHEAAELRKARQTLRSGGDASIDDLRAAFLGARQLFDALVGDGAEADAPPARVR